MNNIENTEENEILCKNCNFVFNDKQLYNIHLIKNKCEKNNLGNRYCCPVCDRQFRLLSNLQRHQETIKHQELLKQNESLLNLNSDENIKIINVDLTSRKKELNFDEMNELNRLKLEMPSINLEIESELELENEQFIVYNNNNNVDDTEENKDNNVDDFLINLKKQREKELYNITPTQTQAPITVSNFNSSNSNSNFNSSNSNSNFNSSNFNSSNSNFNYSDSLMNNNLKFTMREDLPLDLKVEIQKTQFELSQNQNQMEMEMQNDESNDDILLSIQKNRTIKYNITKLTPTQPQQINQQPIQPQQPTPKILKQTQPIQKQQNQRLLKQQQQQQLQAEKLQKTNQSNQPPKSNIFPAEYKDTPLWKQLSELVKNPNNDFITKNIVLSFVNMPLNYYGVLCAFIFYSDDLNVKIQLKITLIKSMIDILNNYIKIYNNKQFVWNNKNVVMAINLLQKCNLNQLLDKLTNEAKQKN
jgi:hypothetical protein